MPTKGITISVTAETNSGGRSHMEDYLAVNLSPNEVLRQIPELQEQAYVGVFDGHGGKEAAKFARERLWELIQTQPKYLSLDNEAIQESIEEAFLALHDEMIPLRETWKRNKTTGDLSTAGTTASMVIFRQDNIFVANVGDSTAVLAVQNPNAHLPGQHPLLAKTLTKDHKPEDPDETKQIERLGGKVMVSRKGVPRVVWERQRKGEESQVDMIPFLSVSRSLGDFWSFNPRTKQFVVSPKPDVHVHPLDPANQKFIVVATDGLWNVMSPREVVEFIWDYEHDNQKCHQPKDVVRAVINEALRKWHAKNLLADNIAVLIAFLSEEDNSDCQPSMSGLSGSSCSMNGEVSSSSAPSHETEVSTEQRDHSEPPAPGVIKHISKTKSGSTTYYRETLPDGVTIEYQTKIKLRHRRKEKRDRHRLKGTHSNAPSRKDSSSLPRTGLDLEKRARREGPMRMEEPPAKRTKLESDSGCEVETMETASPESEQKSPPPTADGHGFGSESSSGVFSEPEPEGLLRPALALGCATPEMNE